MSQRREAAVGTTKENNQQQPIISTAPVPAVESDRGQIASLKALVNVQSDSLAEAYEDIEAMKP